MASRIGMDVGIITDCVEIDEATGAVSTAKDPPRRPTSRTVRAGGAGGRCPAGGCAFHRQLQDHRLDRRWLI
jgi:hypothetical protein